MCASQQTGIVRATGTTGYSTDAGNSIASSSRAKRFDRHYTGSKHYSAGTIPATSTVYPELYRQQALFNRQCTGNMHYSTGTISATSSIQPALHWRQALFKAQHFSTGTIPATSTIQPALYRKRALLNRYYGETPTVLLCFSLVC